MPILLAFGIGLGIAAIVLANRGSGGVVTRTPPRTPPTPPTPPAPSTVSDTSDTEVPTTPPTAPPAPPMTQRSTGTPSAKGGGPSVSPPTRPPTPSATPWVRVTPYAGPGVSRPNAPPPAPTVSRPTVTAPTAPPQPWTNPAPAPSSRPPQEGLVYQAPSAPTAPSQPEIRPLTEAELAARHASLPRPAPSPEIRPLTEAELAARHASAPVQPGTPLPDPPRLPATAPSEDEYGVTADGTRVNLTQSRILAPQVATAVRAHGPRGAHDIVETFQLAAGLFPADGIYGGATRDALAFYGVANPPATSINPQGRYARPQ